MSVPYEPTADMRQVARTLRDMFQALIQEGFTEQHALVIIGQALSASIAAAAGTQ